MANMRLTRQILSFNKTVFDNSYFGVTVLQNFTESMMNGYFRQFPWMTEESTKPFRESFHYFRQMGDSCKEAVDRGFDALADMVPAERLAKDCKATSAPVKKTAEGSDPGKTSEQSPASAGKRAEPKVAPTKSAIANKSASRKITSRAKEAAPAKTV